MPDKVATALKNPDDNIKFLTFDDLSDLAEKLVEGLDTLGKRKYPLGIRRGVKYLPNKNPRNQLLRTSTKTFFFDIKQTHGGKSYLKITENRPMTNRTAAQRSSLIVFEENLDSFVSLITQLAENLNRSKSLHIQ